MLSRRIGSSLAAAGVVAVLLNGAALASAAPTVYLGDGKGYSIAFKSEPSGNYVLEFAGTDRCYYTEPHEDLGPAAFSSFPAPTLMKEAPKAFVAEASVGIGPYGGADSLVRATFGADAVTGTYNFDESEESFHCDTGFGQLPFEARRYAPIGTPGAAPKSGERAVWYEAEGPTQIFMRKNRNYLTGIRGSFAPLCPVGGESTIPASAPLFAEPGYVKRAKNGWFHRKVETSGGIQGGGSWSESTTINAWREEAAVTGSYTRVRTTEGNGLAPQRCVTELPFDAVRYVPATG
jgi:hypothetical protein